MPTGAKSILCLVWNMSVLVRISMTERGCRGVAMANRASWGGAAVPSASVFPCKCRYFRRPLKFRAWRGDKVKHQHVSIVTSQLPSHPDAEFCFHPLLCTWIWEVGSTRTVGGTNSPFRCRQRGWNKPKSSLKWWKQCRKRVCFMCQCEEGYVLLFGSSHRSDVFSSLVEVWRSTAEQKGWERFPLYDFSHDFPTSYSQWELRTDTR